MTTPYSQVVSRKKEEKKMQKSSKELGELKKTIEKWSDIAVVVVLIGKTEALLARIIAVHYYDLQRDHPGVKTYEITKVFKRGKKPPKDNDKLKYLKKAIEEDDFEEVCQRVDQYKWLENDDTRRLLLKHKQLEDKKQLIIGLMHEYISVVRSESHELIENKVKELKYGNENESKFLKEIGTDLDKMRKIRNQIIHTRQEHRFKHPGEQIEEQTGEKTPANQTGEENFEERDTFLKKYKDFVKFCIEKKKWLGLSTQEQESTVAEYLKPCEDFWNMREVLKTYEEKIADLEGLYTKLKEDHVEKSRKIAKLERLYTELEEDPKGNLREFSELESLHFKLKEDRAEKSRIFAELEGLYPKLEGDLVEKLRKLKKERDDYEGKYNDLLDHIRNRKQDLEYWILDTTTKIEDGRETASEGVVKNIQEIENVVEQLLDVPETRANPHGEGSDEEDTEDEDDAEENNA